MSLPTFESHEDSHENLTRHDYMSLRNIHITNENGDHFGKQHIILPSEKFTRNLV